MRRGEVWWVNFEPSIGGETRKRRPAGSSQFDLPNDRNPSVSAAPLAWRHRGDRADGLRAIYSAAYSQSNDSSYANESYDAGY